MKSTTTSSSLSELGQYKWKQVNSSVAISPNPTYPVIDKVLLNRSTDDK